MQTTCDYCGRTISKGGEQLKRDEHHFCDKECFNRWDNGGRTKYDRWNLMYAIILADHPVKATDIYKHFDKHRSLLYTDLRDMREKNYLKYDKRCDKSSDPPNNTCVYSPSNFVKRTLCDTDD